MWYNRCEKPNICLGQPLPIQNKDETMRGEEEEEEEEKKLRP
jgi:hypothetical protein